MPRKQKKYHFTYKTTNTKTGRYYYGMHSTDCLNDGYLGSGKRLRYSINKHGKDCHIREILEFFKSREELVEREKQIITLDEIAKEDCMNLMTGGHGGTCLEKTRRKISESLKGRSLPLEIIKKMSDAKIGKVLSTETKEKIRNSLLGQTLTDERKRKISKKVKERLLDKTNHSMYGKSHSEETKQKMSLAQRGIKKRTLECPHCGKVGGEPQMKQWHFDKCKLLIN